MADQGFTDDEFATARAKVASDEEAYAYLWRERAARYSSLIDITEGSSTRRMSQLYTNALDMMRYYEAKAGTDTSGRRPARTRRIERA